MVGYISNAVANALKAWPTLGGVGIIPVRATEGTTVLTNTPLPAVAVHVVGDDGEGNTFLGGGIRQYFELALYVLLPITNYSFSADAGAQSDILDVSDEVIRCMEQSIELEEVKRKHDFNIQYDRMDTETTYATQGSLSVTVDVHKVIYKGSVELDPRNPADRGVLLEEVKIQPNSMI